MYSCFAKQLFYVLYHNVSGVTNMSWAASLKVALLFMQTAVDNNRPQKPQIRVRVRITASFKVMVRVWRWWWGFFSGEKYCRGGGTLSMIPSAHLEHWPQPPYPKQFNPWTNYGIFSNWSKVIFDYRMAYPPLLSLNSNNLWIQSQCITKITQSLFNPLLRRSVVSTQRCTLMTVDEIILSFFRLTAIAYDL